MSKGHKNNLTFKQGYENLGQLNIERHMFYEEFEQPKCTRVILIRIHDLMF